MKFMYLLSNFICSKGKACHFSLAFVRAYVSYRFGRDVPVQ